MATTKRFVAAEVPPIPEDLRHDYKHDPDTHRCTTCRLPKRNRRIHRPSDATRAEWVEHDERRLGEYVP